VPYSSCLHRSHNSRKAASTHLRQRAHLALVSAKTRVAVI